jgi:hypothetical protein
VEYVGSGWEGSTPVRDDRRHATNSR